MTRRPGAAGTTAAEFAIATGVVLVLVFATFDIGRLFAAQHALDFGVEKAVRYAVVNSTTATSATIKSKLVTAITPAIGATQAAAAIVSVTFSPSEKIGGTVTVTASLAWTASAAGDFMPAVTLNSAQTLTILH
jgi:Flp pilus assembly protein TadG